MYVTIHSYFTGTSSAANSRGTEIVYCCHMLVNLQTRGGPSEHLWQKGTAESANPVLRVGSHVFANLQAGQPKDSRILEVAPADEKDDEQWLEVANECFLTRLDVRDHSGRLIPEVDVQSALTGATVLASFNLKSWRWNKAKPTGFSADLPNFPLPAPSWTVPTGHRDYAVGAVRPRLDGMPVYPSAGRQPMVYVTPQANDNASNEASSEVTGTVLINQNTTTGHASTAIEGNVVLPAAVNDTEQSSAAVSNNKVAVQPMTPLKTHSTNANDQRTCNLNDVYLIAGSAASVGHKDSHQAMPQGPEVADSGSKPTAVTTVTVGKVASFMFGEDELPLKELVNANGKRRSSVQNAKAGPSKVARMAGKASD
ncbi:hypothetical protein C8R41DRAFT_870721 [Lentinula lateritia]|uniref:Uncharacterized protein n=1 Tax=Lentinula lateritia TaxID=40482 RepID=A0ABQ8V3F5_9AGAR|nr:hypothetical protein C8R41DRAFT_870721 [Lentinula lateritia]